MPLTQEEIDGCRDACAFLALFISYMLCMAGSNSLVYSPLRIATSDAAFPRAVLSFDKDRSGSIDVWELRQVLEGVYRLKTTVGASSCR